MPNISEQRRAGVIAAVNAFPPFLTLIGVLHWSANALAGCSVVVTTMVTAIFLFLPNQAPAPVVEAPSGP